MMVRSRIASPDGSLKLILGGYTTDHRSVFKERWDGWYVSSASDHGRHMGNTVFTDEDEPEAIPVRIDQAAYLFPYRDIAALLVFNHQMYMMNLLTRIGWEARAGLKGERHDLSAVLHDAANALVDYLLFVDEAELQCPCSYMIYADAFESLPKVA
jgi:hypothetical protein